MQDIGAEVKNTMKKTIKLSDTQYTDEPVRIGKRVYDLAIPSPAEVAELINKRSKKVTITLDKSSVDFFKKQASVHNTKYQTMIKMLLSEYVRKAQQSHLKSV